MGGWVEYGLQLLLPVVLVRYLSPTAFGEYRAVWLLAATVLAIAPFYLPQSLMYFLPRASADTAPKYITAAVLSLAASATVVAVMFSTLPMERLPGAAGVAGRHSLLVASFLGLWVLASLTDVLALAQSRARAQALIVISLAVLRAVLVGGGAFLFGDLQVVLGALCVLALLKCAVIPFLVQSSSTGVRWHTDLPTVRSQWRYVTPFALGNALFLLRGQADQWVVAGRFPADVFAVFSIATVAVSLSNLIRQPALNAYLPTISRLLGEGRRKEAVRLVSTSYSTVAVALLPFIGLLLVLIPDAVELIYTREYAAAAPIMQIYTLGQLVGFFAAGHLLPILGCGRTATAISAAGLILSVLLGTVGAVAFGPIGAAAGSISSLLLGELWALRTTVRKLETRVGDLLDLRLGLRLLVVVIVAAGTTFLVLGWLPAGSPVGGRLVGGGLLYLAVGGVVAALLGLKPVVLRLLSGSLASGAGASVKAPLQ
jgi:O-antigen/teichoic acid export membrane protein